MVLSYAVRAVLAPSYAAPVRDYLHEVGWDAEGFGSVIVGWVEVGWGVVGRVMAG